MINPHLLKPSYTRIIDIRTGRKVYAPAYSLHGRVFKSCTTRRKTATEAIAYSVRMIARWTRLSDAAITMMITEAPAETG
jgi:hypothetical protein